jgi:hypothetical protein
MRFFIYLLIFATIYLMGYQKGKETKNYRVNERKESLYRDSIGIEKEYIDSNPIINKYEY